MIILDIDGVVVDLFEELDYLLKKDGHNVDHWQNWSGYAWNEAYPDISLNIIDSILKNPLTVKNAKAFSDAWYWTNHHSSTYDIMYLTARDKSLDKYTWDWFYEWDVPVDFVVFEENKVEFLQQLEVTVFVDDNPEMAQGAHEAGIPSYLLNRPYNLNADVDPKIRIDSLWDIKCV
jgi:uncharacterized HAD superfamily protein